MSLDALKLLALISVALYYAKKTHQESLGSGDPSIFAHQTQKMLDAYLAKTKLNAEAKSRISEAVNRAARHIMEREIQRARLNG